ncbi:Flp family type IVb pilin, partial [Methylobacterium sp. A54F]
MAKVPGAAGAVGPRKAERAAARLRAFARDARGATAIEYALIGVLISTAIVASARAVGSQVGTLFNTVNTQVTT